MNDAYETIEYKGCTIEIRPEEYAEDPRDMMTAIGELYERSDGYSTRSPGIGKKVNFEYYDLGWTQFLKEEDESTPIAFAMPVRVDDCGSYGWRVYWDEPVRPGGEIADRYNALLVVTKKECRETMMRKLVTPKARAQMEQNARYDLDALKHWLEGEVWRWVAVDERGIQIDSCGGYYEDWEGYVLDEAKEAIDHYVSKRESKAALAALAGI